MTSATQTTTSDRWLERDINFGIGLIILLFLTALGSLGWSIREDSRANSRAEAVRLSASDQARADAKLYGVRLTQLIQRDTAAGTGFMGSVQPPISRQALAEMLGLESPRDIWRMESGDRPMSPGQIAQICAIYEVEEAWFTEWVDTQRRFRAST